MWKYLINLVQEIYYCCFFVYIHKIQTLLFFIDKTFFYVKIVLNQFIRNNLNKENKIKLEDLLKKVANEWNFEICNLNIQTSQNPIVIEIFIKKTNGDDISLDDCAQFNKPVSEEIEKLNFLNCSYVLEISSQGVSDELTSERDFKTFKGFPVNVELNQQNSKIKFLNGLLYKKSKDYLAINIKGKIKKIPFDEVLKISLCTLKD